MKDLAARKGERVLHRASMGLVLVLFAFMLAGAGVRAAHAAPATTVVQPVTCTMSNGAPSATLTLTESDGSKPNPSTISCDGEANQNVTVDASTTLIATEPTKPPQNTQYLFSNGEGSTDTPTCGTSPCSVWTFTDYEQVSAMVSYSIAGGGSPTAPTLHYTSLGSASATYTLTSSVATRWLDYGSTWSVTPTPLTGSTNTERWDATSGLNGLAEPGATISPTFYNQFALTLSYSTADGSTPSSPPTFTAEQFGTPVITYLTTSEQTVWYDASPSSVAFVVSNPISSAPTTERWMLSPAEPATGSITSASTTAFEYYRQFFVTFQYSVSDETSPPKDPGVTYVQFGSTLTLSATTTGTPAWADANTAYSYDNPTGGSSVGERWEAASTPMGTVTASSVLDPEYFHQFAFTLAYEVKGPGSGYSAPSISYSSLGSLVNGTLAPGATTLWLDASTFWSVANPLQGSGSSLRWATDQGTNGTSTATTTEDLDYYAQYYVSFQYSVTGGSGYSAPTVSFLQFGTEASGSQGWVDAGSTYNYTDPLAGSSPTQRWYAESPSGKAGSSSAVALSFYYQYSFLVNYTVEGGGSGYSGPTMTFTAFGLPATAQVNGSIGPLWLDGNSSWSVSDLLPGSGQSERWTAAGVTSGVLAASASMSLKYYNQFSLALAYAISGSGLPTPPTLSFTALGAQSNGTLGANEVAFWADAGSSWSLTNPLLTSSSSSRWLTSQATSGVVGAAFARVVTYEHQYSFRSAANDDEGGSESPAGWYDQGANLSITASPKGGWQFVGWVGNGADSYSGTDANVSISMAGPVNETAVFYPGLVIDSGTDGSVAYSSASQSGNVSARGESVVYVPPGTTVTLVATPSPVLATFEGWTGALSNSQARGSVTLNGPEKVTASFGVDYTDITTFVAVVVPVVVLSVYVFAVRRKQVPGAIGPAFPPEP